MKVQRLLRCYRLKIEERIKSRSPQDVDVLAVLDFENPCSRPESHPRRLLIQHEGQGENEHAHGRRKGSGRPGRRRPAEP